MSLFFIHSHASSTKILKIFMNLQSKWRALNVKLYHFNLDLDKKSNLDTVSTYTRANQENHHLIHNLLESN